MAKTKNEDRTDFNPAELEEMEEVEGEAIPEPFRFDTIGDSITGKYLRTGEVEGEYKKQRIYIIEAISNGKQYTLYSNADLLSKMKKVRVGSHVSIEYISDEPMPGDMNPRRIFRVRHTATKAAPASSGPKKL